HPDLPLHPRNSATSCGASWSSPACCVVKPEAQKAGRRKVGYHGDVGHWIDPTKEVVAAKQPPKLAVATRRGTPCGGGGGCGARFRSGAPFGQGVAAGGCGSRLGAPAVIAASRRTSGSSVATQR